MSERLGADTRRVDLMVERLHGYSQDTQHLRTIAQRAVAEMRNAWSGPDFERIAQRWEQEGGPRLTDVSSALAAMATALRAQAEEQRQASGNPGGSSVPAGPGGTPGGLTGGGSAGGGGGASSWRGDDEKTNHGKFGPVETMTIGTPNGNHTDTRSSTYINGHQVGIEENRQSTGGDGVSEPTAADRVKLNLAQGEGTLVDASLVSLDGGNDNFQYELSADKVEATADYSVDVDAHGNLVASAGVSAAAYLGYAAGKMHGGSDFANGTIGGKAYVGAEVKADASGSIGPDGAKGHLGAEAFAGGKAEVNASGTVAGVTAMAGAEMSYGIGARAKVDAELSATNVGVAVDIGATLRIGAGVKLDASVNPQEVIANVGHAVDDVGNGLEDAGDQVANFLHW